jgi:hypothetical protein
LKEEKKVRGKKKYRTILCVDLRAFDNREVDYGVETYLERLGYIPDCISLLETSVEQIHQHNGVIDDEKLSYLWCSEREMPGGQVWSKRNLLGLVQSVQKAGSKFFMGCLASPNRFVEYNVKAEWLYKNYDLFIVDRDGNSTRDRNGAINPLRRMPDGSYYEDKFFEDLMAFLLDYGMDGFFAGDGWIGLPLPLGMGDYHPDMIEQFEQWASIKIPDGEIPERASYIWDTQEMRAAWINFYAERWTAFYSKFGKVMKEAKKSVVTLDPWARGPADALFDFGIDYKKISSTGIDGLCLQAREENWGRRGREWLYVWEPGEVASIASIKAAAPDINLYWAICTTNAPEHWIATRDVTNCLERQCLSLPTVTYINQQGEYKRALDGVLTIFGTDLLRSEWDWLTSRWDFGFNSSIKKAHGPVIVWSENVLSHHTKMGKRWNVIAPLIKYILGGAPIHSAVNTENLDQAAADAIVLVEPLGLTDREAERIVKKRRQGTGLVVIGKVDNAILLNELGVRPVDIAIAEEKEIEVHKRNLKSILGEAHAELEESDFQLHKELDLADYEAAGAGSILSAKTGAGPRALAAFQEGKGDSGRTVFIRRCYPWPEGYVRGRYLDMKQLMLELPDAVDRLTAGLINWAAGEIAKADEGQIYLFEKEDGEIHLGVENIANLFYIKPHLTFAASIKMFNDYALKRPNAVGYISFERENSNSLDITIPPDGVVPLRIRLKE